MKKYTEPELLSLSYLDLLCCGFVAVLLLALLQIPLSGKNVALERIVRRETIQLSSPQPLEHLVADIIMTNASGVKETRAARLMMNTSVSFHADKDRSTMVEVVPEYAPVSADQIAPNPFMVSACNVVVTFEGSTSTETAVEINLASEAAGSATRISHSFCRISNARPEMDK